MGFLNKLKKMIEPSSEVVEFRKTQKEITLAFDELRIGQFDVKYDSVSKDNGNINKTSTTVFFQSKDYPKLKLKIKKDRNITKNGHEGWDEAHVQLTTHNGQKIDLIPHTKLSHVTGKDYMSVIYGLADHASSHEHGILSALDQFARPNQNWSFFLKRCSQYTFPQAKIIDDTLNIPLMHQTAQRR